MSQTLSPSVARCYGLARVARVWSVSRASVYRSREELRSHTIARHVPVRSAHVRTRNWQAISAGK